MVFLEKIGLIVINIPDTPGSQKIRMIVDMQYIRVKGKRHKNKPAEKGYRYPEK
jgi:hypothetical protein